MKKKLSLLLLICIISALSINAEIYSGSCGENVNYSLDTETGVLSITGTGAMADYTCTYDDGDIEDCSVPWYGKRSYITTVEIANGVTSIGNNAFANCPQFTITIPNSVTSIGRYAFQKSGITSIAIPNSVTEIKDGTFKESSLQSIEIPNSVTSIGNSAFKESGLRSIEIPNSVTSIGNYAFDYCSLLTSVTLSNNLYSIGGYAFRSCVMSSITIPDGVNRIENNAFYRCALKSVTLGKGVKTIEVDAFSCMSLKEICCFAENVPNTNSRSFDYVSDVTLYVPEASVDAYRTAWGFCSTVLAIDEDGKVISGPCGENVNFSLNLETGVLSVTGTGANTSNPWKNKLSQIKSVEIADGVTSICSYAFFGCSSLTSVTIPNSVTSIGSQAFYNCSGLTSVTIPNSVTSIGDYAFYNCSGLSSVISEIEEPFAFGSSAFYGIPSYCVLAVPYGTRDAYIAAGWTTDVFKGGIEEIEIISGSCGENVNYSLNLETGVLSITGTGAMADYSSEEEVPWYEQRGNIKSVEIADGVTTIGNNAFKGCSSLTSVTTPNSVTSIGERAFNWCTHLTSFDIPNSVTSIGNYAFERCDNLTSLTIGNSVTSIGSFAFEQCAFTSIVIPSSVTSMGEKVFAYCTHLTSIVVADGNTKYDSRDNCNAMIETATNTLAVGCKNTIIPNSVTSIGGGAFYGSGLTSIEIPNSVTEIKGGGAFARCSSLTSVTIPNSVTSIGKRAFEGCSGLTSVTIPNSVTEIGVWAFSDCNSLTSINIPNSVTSIQACAFNRTGLTSVTIPNRVTSIEERVFKDCSGLTSIDIPNSVTSIGYGAFNRCSSLESVTIPNSVTVIRKEAFSECSSLTEVYCNAVNVPNTSTDAFDNVDLSNATLYVPAASLAAYQAAAPWSGFGTIEPDENILSGSCGENVNYTFNLETGALSITGTGAMADYSNREDVPWYDFRSNIKSVEIADGVTSIGEWAFYECVKLASVDIPNSVTSIGEWSFSWCRGLSTIEIPNNVTSIGEGTFYGSDGLTSITIPNSVTSIGGDAFYGCSLTSIIIPNGVTSIEAGAFSGCSGITSIVVESENTKYDSRDNCNAIIETATNTLVAGCKNTIIPDNVTSIGGRAFYGCSGLTSVTIPNNVTYIGEGAFYGCSSLTSIDIPNSVTLIDGSAFCGCTGITSITIPNSITSIWDRAFDGCSGLTEVYCYAENVPDTYANAFENVDLSNATLYVPAASIEAYQAAEPWSQFGNIMKIDTDISQMDNVMYVESFEGHSASQVIMPIQMKNSAAIRGFQFDIYLPEGVTVVKSAKGKILASLTESRLPEDDEHTLTLSEQGDGSIRFLCGSLYDETFTGNDGEIVTLTVKIDENMSDGDYPIILRNIKLTETDISKYYETPLVRSTLSVVSYMLGDINGDGKVDVSDYIGIANHILGNTPEGFVLKAADVNEDGLIDVSDYIGVANIILTGSIYGGNSNARMMYFQEERNQEVDPE